MELQLSEISEWLTRAPYNALGPQPCFKGLVQWGSEISLGERERSIRVFVLLPNNLLIPIRDVD